LSTISPDCFGCWDEFFASVANLASADRNVCVSDPTGASCVAILESPITAFTQCAGFDPLLMDYDFLIQAAVVDRTSSIPNSGSILSGFTGSIFVIITVMAAVMAL